MTNKRKGECKKQRETSATLRHLVEQMETLSQAVAELRCSIRQQAIPPAKLWYTTGELAAALGRSQYTIQARWCAEGRIECTKDQTGGKWRIPAREYERLVRGGSLKAKAE
jgi:hypothetical protein